MRIFAIKRFHAWAKGHELTDALLRRAVEEIAQGNVEANLGGHLYKKRIATKGRGKSGSVRTLVAYSAKQRTFFLYAFEKNDQSNITPREKIALQELGKFYLGLTDKELTLRLKNRAIIEVKEEGSEHGR
ncbi:MAG TPA: type II toxin-antitoxin system RelE/ParE family toxin [Candidatus Saccharimonadales bacterium]|nr:type II toxin-antitoxin system RelE/ParE family toxin [Candidatus Saccharimonadales bacterium]